MSSSSTPKWCAAQSFNNMAPNSSNEDCWTQTWITSGKPTPKQARQSSQSPYESGELAQPRFTRINLCFQRQLSVRLFIKYSATRKLRKLLIFPIWGRGLQIFKRTRDFPSQVPLRLHTVYCSPVTAHRLLFTGCRYPCGGKSPRRS